MLTKKITELINKQINAELYSAYLYLAFAGYFDHAGLAGFANWYRVQSLEEIDHAMIFHRYLTDEGECVRLGEMAGASAEGMSIPDVLRETLAHEQKVTAMIDAICSEASAANDLRTLCLLNWFVREQAEEEKNAGEMIRKYLLFGACNMCVYCDAPNEDADPGLCGSGLYALDRELAGRVHNAPQYPLG